MTEYIGARISLVSKSDIRYSGILHEINSENSTVALENVKSYGTEGRRNGEEEIPPSDNLYEYIVFRGSDVKDLRIEQPAKEAKPPPPQMPDDPAILGAARPQPQQQPAQRAAQNSHQQGFGGPGGQGQYPPQWGHHPPPYGGRGFGPPGGFPGGPGGPGGYPQFGGGYPGMQYGAPPPPGWHHGPGQGFPPGPPGPPSHFPPGPMGAPGQQPQPPSAPRQREPEAFQTPANGAQGKPTTAQKAVDGETASRDQSKNKDGGSAPSNAVQKAPPPPVETKPDVAAALAAPQSAPTTTQKAPTGPKSGRFVPAVPLPGAQSKSTGKPALTEPSLLASKETNVPTTSTASDPAPVPQSATDAATAAVAAAMAKLSQSKPSNETGAMDNLQRKVADMRADERGRHTRQPGTGGYVTGHRGGRGRGRGAHHHAPHAKVEVPQTDFDFESANAKFSKLDLAKEVVASGSPLGEEPHVGNDAGENNPENVTGNQDGDATTSSAAQATYNKSSSFFDNISSELRDRQESASQKFDGAQFRSEERQKNLETFGQGSVDGFRGGYRGRGRGRGFRGRGGPRGRGAGYGRGGAAQASGKTSIA